MITISNNYAIKYELSLAPHYKWLDDNSCYNAKTGKIIKKVLNNRSIGYVIDGKFKSLKYLKEHLVKPSKIFCPF